jgi:tetratricopeptide (TPR) repeat protein
MRSPSILSRPELGRIAALVVMLSAGLAAAAPPESEAVRQSREHYRKGDEAYAAGRYDEAYQEFDKGYQLVPRPAFLVNLGHTERRRGNLVSARAFYQKFLLIEPQSKYATALQQVIQEIDSALAAETASQFPTASVPAAGELVPLLPAPEAAGTAPPAAVIAQPLPPVRPIYKRWWVWATGGAVVAAGLTTALLLGRSSYQQEGSLGTLGH